MRTEYVKGRYKIKELDTSSLKNGSNDKEGATRVAYLNEKEVKALLKTDEFGSPLFVKLGFKSIDFID